MRRLVWAGIMVLAPAAGAAEAACLPPQPSLIFASCTGSVRAELVLLGPGTGVPDAIPATGLAVTGTYTSGEEPEPEGFVMDRGTAVDPYIQGWDGLLLLDVSGAPTLAHVERVSLGDETYNLRKTSERRAFVEQASQQTYSAIQSHLLIVDGEVDVREQVDAPRFRRRILFTGNDGMFGVYDSSPRALTLYQAATELAARFAPEMAFNLDMGSYDYCSHKANGVEISCGALERSQTGKLSNILVFHQD